MEGARRARADDAVRLAELRVQAHAELANQRGAKVFLAREVAPCGVLPTGCDDGPPAVWVGTFDDVVVGYVTAEVEVLADGAKLGRLAEVYVEPGARAVGIGEAMLDLVLEWLGARGCSGVDAYALPGMRDTKNFFETFGFTARLLVVHHRLDE